MLFLVLGSVQVTNLPSSSTLMVFSLTPMVMPKRPRTSSAYTNKTTASTGSTPTGERAERWSPVAANWSSSSSSRLPTTSTSLLSSSTKPPVSTSRHVLPALYPLSISIKARPPPGAMWSALVPWPRTTSTSSASGLILQSTGTKTPSSRKKAFRFALTSAPTPRATCTRCATRQSPHRPVWMPHHLTTVSSRFRI